MRCMSFHLTADAIRNGTKDVTRRLGWRDILVGDVFEGVVKYRGVRVADRQSLGVFRVVSVRREQLNYICLNDVRRREGYPGWTQAQFIDHFCKAMRCDRNVTVTRIEFKRQTKERRQ